MFQRVREISDVAQNILKKRYFAPGESSWEELVNRVCSENTVLYFTEDERNAFKEMLLNTYFVPNSPCLVNSGKENAGKMACFVLDFKDTIEEIYKTKLGFAQVARKGGGCGTTLSKIRPKGSIVNGSAHGYAGGPIKFADTISHDMSALTQAGFREMAIMFTMSIYCPDIVEFITAKSEEGKIANANISVVVDDAFMKKVENDETYWTEFDGVKYQEYKARDIFNLIVEGAWRNGEPGILYYDKLNDSPYKYSGQEIMATNPCAEQGLPPNGCCNLGSFDVSKFIIDGKVNYDLLTYGVKLAVKFLNNVIDTNKYPNEEIENWSLSNRPIGIGIMGFADLLLRLKIAYGSEESIQLLKDILTYIYVVAKQESENLSNEYVAPENCKVLPEPRYNITLTTVAPTGTVSLIAGCSSGIEPIFSEITVRNDKTGIYLFENDLSSQPYFRCAVAANGGIEVTWEEHIKILAAAQSCVDSGVSKTINFPTNTHRETIAKAFIMAWKMGCKGLAVYRNGSRKVEVLSPKNLKKDKCPKCDGELIALDGIKKCTNPACGFVLEKEE